MPDIDLEKTGRWLGIVAASHGKRVGNINYLFCSDADILDANRKYLGHDYFTDIITFDYSHDDKIAGDIYLSLVTVATNAEELGEPYRRELMAKRARDNGEGGKRRPRALERVVEAAISWPRSQTGGNRNIVAPVADRGPQPRVRIDAIRL